MSSLFGPDEAPVAIGDAFDSWALMTLRRSDYTINAALKKHTDDEGLRRLALTIAEQLRKAYAMGQAGDDPGLRREG